MSLKKGTAQIEYAYDMDGIRTSKIEGSYRHDYVTQNGKVVRELVTNKTTGAFVRCLDFFYDASGNPFAMRKYKDATLGSYDTFHYVLNAQGDVVQINYQGGTVYAKYTYDAWGNVLTATGSLASINPLRYRGYYYDTETGWYYLQSRYYDPAVGRFINADEFVSTGQGVLGHNMFVYCNNSPIAFSDSKGNRAEVTVTSIETIVLKEYEDYIEYQTTIKFIVKYIPTKRNDPIIRIRKEEKHCFHVLKNGNVRYNNRQDSSAWISNQTISRAMATEAYNAATKQVAGALSGRTISGIAREFQWHYALAAMIPIDKFLTTDVGGTDHSLPSYDYNAIWFEIILLSP